MGRKPPPTLLRNLKLDDVRPAGKPILPWRDQGGGKTVSSNFCASTSTIIREHRNQPQTDDVSHMSKYLHFGQISPVWLATEARQHKSAGRENIVSFIDELLVRRELAINFCHFNQNYDRYEAMPDWAKKSLGKHRRDKRNRTYTRAELEAGATHDPYWNAAMREMRVTGYMHNYMRMYWGKKILEWSRHARRSARHALCDQQQIFPRRTRPQFLRQHWLALRPARSPLAGAKNLRQGPLHERGRPRAKMRHPRLRRKGQRR